MSANLPPLNWLRAFEASARHLSFTGAAEELHMTQPAVSQQIKSLENALGRPLFQRRARGLELTDAGRSYLPSVQASFELLVEGTQGLIGGTQDNTLEIQTNLSFAIYWLTPRLDAFLAAQERVQLKIVTAIWPSEAISTSTGVEVRFGQGASIGQIGERLTRDRFYPVCRPEIAERLATPNDLAQLRLFDVTGLLEGWERWIAAHPEASIKAPPVHRASTYAVTLSCALQGLGVALAHDTLAGTLLARGELVRPFEFTVPMREAYYLIAPSKDRASPAARAFSDWIRAEMAVG